MEEKIIKIRKSDCIKLKLVTEDGEPTGEYLEVRVKDIDAPERFQAMIDELRKSSIEFRDKSNIIEKQQDQKIKGKLLSKNKKAQYDLLKEHFKKRVEIYNRFLGENGVEKLLNWQPLSWDAFEYIDEVIDKQIAPYIDKSLENMTDRIREKYQFNIQKENVLE